MQGHEPTAMTAPPDARAAAPGGAPTSPFAQLFEQHAARVVRFARLLGARDPEDVAQDAFCRLFRRLDSGAGATDVADPAAYLNRTVVNLVRDRHRRRFTADRWIVLSRRDAEQTAPTSDHVALRSDEARGLMAALHGLPHRRREAVVLRYWADLTYPQIADAMGTSLGAAKSAVSRGLDDLHRQLAPDTDGARR